MIMSSSIQALHSLRSPRACFAAPMTSSSSSTQTILNSPRVRFGGSVERNSCRSRVGLGSYRFRTMATVRVGGERTEDHFIVDDSVDAMDDSQVMT